MSACFYQPKGLADCPAHVDTARLKGQTVVITGGSSGLGYCYTKAFWEAGSFVVIFDVHPPPDPLDKSRAVFVKCDVTVWAEQAAAFQTAVHLSPNRRIDIVIANAGIAGADVLAGIDDESPEPPPIGMINVNLIGALYTTKLAGWYFHRHLEPPAKGCLILVSSIMAYIDTQSSGIYAASKFAVRGLMCYLRRKGHLRVNSIAPWYIRTPIMKGEFLDDVQKQLQQWDLGLASTESAVTAVFRIATDPSLNGRSLAVVPSQISLSGYMDLGLDDFHEGTPEDKLQKAVSSLKYVGYGHNIGS